jgi:hypothetical protein
LGVFGDLETGVFLALTGLGVCFGVTALATLGVVVLAGVFGAAFGVDGFAGVFLGEAFGVATFGVASLAGVFLGETLGVTAFGVALGVAAFGVALGVAAFGVVTFRVTALGVASLAGVFLGETLGVATFATLGVEGLTGVAAFGVEGLAGIAAFGVDGLAGVAALAALTGDFLPGVTTLTGDFLEIFIGVAFAGVFFGETLAGVALAGVFLGETLAGVFSLAGVGILLGVLFNLEAGLAGVLKGETGFTEVFLIGETLRALTGVATISLCLLLGGAEMSLPGVWALFEFFLMLSALGVLTAGEAVLEAFLAGAGVLSSWDKPSKFSVAFLVGPVAFKGVLRPFLYTTGVFEEAVLTAFLRMTMLSGEAACPVEAPAKLKFLGTS